MAAVRLQPYRSFADSRSGMPSNHFPEPDAPGTIYLLHYSGETSQRHRHYLGWSSDAQARFRRHRSGSGAGETRRAVAQGLRLTQAQTWKGTPALEKRVKEWSRQGRKGFSGICPFCAGEATLPSDLARDLGEPSLRRYQQSP
jgi:predicted GIY-YIG superfamily endonuclease